MSETLIEREQAAGEQIERASERPDPDAAAEGVNRDSPFRLVLSGTGLRPERDEDDAEVVVLHERLGVLTARGLRLAVKLVELSREIELQERGGHRLRVRPPVLAFLVSGF